MAKKRTKKASGEKTNKKTPEEKAKNRLLHFKIQLEWQKKELIRMKKEIKRTDKKIDQFEKKLKK